jgi:hypothetical protein
MEYEMDADDPTLNFTSSKRREEEEERREEMDEEEKEEGILNWMNKTFNSPPFLIPDVPPPPRLLTTVTSTYSPVVLERRETSLRSAVSSITTLPLTLTPFFPSPPSLFRWLTPREKERQGKRRRPQEGVSSEEVLET